MFYRTRYRFHGNTAGSKPALNNGFDLFSENPVVRFQFLLVGELSVFWTIIQSTKFPEIVQSQFSG